MKKQWLSLILVLLIIVGFLYGYSQIFAAMPTTSTTGDVAYDFSSEEIDIPLQIHVIKDSSGLYTSFRDEENIVDIFNDVNRIWSQADIYFQVEEIVISEVNSNVIPNAINGNYLELFSHENFDNSKINVFFTRSLDNINGIALVRINSALVADFTTVNDFRATSHELGHLLGLGHVGPVDRLMARGRNGEILTNGEILIVRENAIELLS